MIELLQAHTWALLLGVFLSRIADQTLDTFRTISIFRGYRFLAALMGFLTVLIWINVAGQVIQNLGQNWYLTVVYAAGYAAGQATGLWVESAHRPRPSAGAVLVAPRGQPRRAALAAQLHR